MTYSHRPLFFLLLLLGACRTVLVPSSPETRLLRVEAATADTLSDAERLLRPYRDSVQGQMRSVLGEGTTAWEKKKPSGSLGNLVTDAMLEEALRAEPRTVNAVCNYGGIRLPRWPAGPITLGQVFELLPFDNELVVMELRGYQLRQWIGLMAAQGGWPLARPLPFDTLKMRRGEAYTDTLRRYSAGEMNGEVYRVSFEPVTDSARYWIATNDYIANGGDQCDFLRNCPRRSTGKLLRDVLAAYIRQHSPLHPDPHARIRIR